MQNLDTITAPLDIPTKQYVDDKVAAGGPPSGTAGGDLTGTYPNPTILPGVIVDADVSASAAIATSKISGLDAALTGKVPTTRQVIAGNGLTGGGALSADVTVNVVAQDSSLVVTADGMYVNSGNVEIVSRKGAASGYASLDSGTKVPIAQIPTGTTASTVSTGDRGLPTGGSAAQVLAKNSATNYDVGWVTQSGGGGGLTRTITVLSSGTTAAGATANTEYVYVCTGAVTVTLPTAVGNKNLYTVKRTGASNVTIGTTSSQTIDGATTFVLDAQWMAVDMISDNANWVVV